MFAGGSAGCRGKALAAMSKSSGILFTGCTEQLSFAVLFVKKRTEQHHRCSKRVCLSKTGLIPACSVKVLVCVVSIFAGALNMVLACELGSSMQLSSLESWTATLSDSSVTCRREL